MEKPEKLNTFMRMLMKEARRNSLIDLCEVWGITEGEMRDCISYLKEKLEVEDL